MNAKDEPEEYERKEVDPPLRRGSLLFGKENVILYHYTSWVHLQEGILPEGQIGLTDSNLATDVTEPHVAWFFNHPNPRLARKNKMLTSLVDKTEVRIVVEFYAAYKWISWAKRQDGFSAKWAATLNEVGNHTMLNWWVTTVPVPLEDFVRIERWNEDKKKYEEISYPD